MAGLRQVEAQLIQMDGLDESAVMRAVTKSRPDVVLQQVIALAEVEN
jgi:hypothetical protein